ncbi:MAG: archaeosine synthase subunit alpha [Archaeoglobaceae archaeon]|nr:archaeosine synthase subunit alpha [Archaeoglobaceae archaeon]MCX8152070.1 archaeosine synthase subunit alpha [Archaeoglobaceae archaeon]MDW8013835.1 archaeosine synthase subunit alpha [Archaeoglobaceae archaeon]
MFYQEKREGYARVGKLNGKRTPLMIELGDELLKKIDFGKAPYSAKFLVDVSEDLLPKGEIFALTGIDRLDARQLFRAFEEVRGKVVYAVAAAKPVNVSLLIYFGADIVDNFLAIAKAKEGIFFTEDYEIPVEESEELCSCKFCEEKDLVGHNTEMVRREVKKCRFLIAKEELRNYVEAKVKHNPELTAALRIADFEGEKELFPRFKRSKCYFSNLESVNRFEVQYFLKRAFECYKPVTKTLLILPCTAKKPYLVSKTHRIIRSKVKVGVNEIIISSPLVVPREFELVYPALNYDTPVTGYWSDEEVSFVASWLEKFVKKGNFEKIVAHVEGGYRKVVERALKDFDVIYTAEGSIISESSLKKLSAVLEDESYNFFDQIFPSISRYQFDLEFDGDVFGKYPEIELYKCDEKVARIDLNYGKIDVYMFAAKRLLKEKKFFVKIGNFEPKGTIFAPGIIEADEKIRPNDTVVFYSDEIIGVGTALMSGKEMINKKKGAAVKVKRVEPLR